MTLWNDIEMQISAHLAQPFKLLEKDSVGGGSINNAWRIGDEKNQFFVKTNRKNLAFMFEAEARALGEIFSTGAIKVPEPITSGVSGHDCYLILSWLPMSGSPDAQQFGEQLAALHRHHKPQFGFDIDNTIGSTPQLNQWSNDWIDFWQKQRLGYQLKLAQKNGFSAQLYDLGLELADNTALFFEGYQPAASLLHGDLWSGNWGALAQGEPVLFDPASYYGDREADLAMMELFGHPGRAFFDAYDAVYPIDDGFALRRNFYNLYHILNHANMFGSSYAMQAENMMESLLAEVR
jgi:fructosamine-3-kinase